MQNGYGLCVTEMSVLSHDCIVSIICNAPARVQAYMYSSAHSLSTAQCMQRTRIMLSLQLRLPAIHKVNKNKYPVSQKSRTLLLTITLPYVDRFSKSFHHQTLQ